MTLTIEDYEQVLADQRRLTRELDVAMHGEEDAAPQASLCDLISLAADMRAELLELRKLSTASGDAPLLAAAGKSRSEDE